MIIPGEKRKIREAIEEARKEKGALTAEQKKQIAKQIHKKEKRIFKRRALIAAVGLSAVIGGTKLLEEPKSEVISNKVENENIGKETKSKSFKEQYKYDVNTQEINREPRDYEKEIKDLKTEEEDIRFVKDMYLEEREQITGDTTITTEDIEIWSNYHNYVYVNEQTGDYITTGKAPAVTEQKLQNDGISCDNTIENVKVYSIINKEDGRILDSVSIHLGNPTKVIPGDQYGEPYISILDKMGKVIPLGLDYAEYIEQGDELAKGTAQDRFIEAAKEYEMTKENQNKKAEQQAEYGE